MPPFTAVKAVLVPPLAKGRIPVTPAVKLTEPQVGTPPVMIRTLFVPPAASLESPDGLAAALYSRSPAAYDVNPVPP